MIAKTARLAAAECAGCLRVTDQRDGLGPVGQSGTAEPCGKQVGALALVDRFRRGRGHAVRCWELADPCVRSQLQQRARYSLTEAGIQTLPVIYAVGNWGLDWRPGTDDLRARQQFMRDGGQRSSRN
jgi:hypothetical protein